MIVFFVLGVLGLTFAAIGVLSVIASSNQKAPSPTVGVMCLAFSMIFILWIFTPVIIPSAVDYFGVGLENRVEKLGAFGDMFGGATSLFSGLAFLGLIATLLLQGKELSLQRDEISRNTDELELTRNEFQLQRFESTLFGLIRQFNEHVAAIEISVHSGMSVEKYVGRKAIKQITDSLPDQIYGKKSFLDSDGVMQSTSTSRSLEEQIESYQKLFGRTLEPDFAPYMRLLYGIFRHIETSEVSEEEKKMYSRIVRAQLSSSELKLILFDCASGVGKDFQHWISKYGLLKHLPLKERENNLSLVALYPTDAFEPVPIPYKRIDGVS